MGHTSGHTFVQIIYFLSNQPVITIQMIHILNVKDFVDTVVLNNRNKFVLVTKRSIQALQRTNMI
jgi:hypothetical protein